MKWGNLAYNKCPNCGGDFIRNLIVNDGVLNCKCDFKISLKRYKEIVTNMNSQRLKHSKIDNRMMEERENQEGMNEL